MKKEGLFSKLLFALVSVAVPAYIINLLVSYQGTVDSFEFEKMLPVVIPVICITMLVGLYLIYKWSIKEGYLWITLKLIGLIVIDYVSVVIGVLLLR